MQQKTNSITSASILWENSCRNGVPHWIPCSYRCTNFLESISRVMFPLQVRWYFDENFWCNVTATWGWKCWIVVAENLHVWTIQCNISSCKNVIVSILHLYISTKGRINNELDYLHDTLAFLSWSRNVETSSLKTDTFRDKSSTSTSDVLRGDGGSDTGCSNFSCNSLMKERWKNVNKVDLLYDHHQNFETSLSRNMLLHEKMIFAFKPAFSLLPWNHS